MLFSDQNDLKILVTGGAGFLGSHLVDELLKRGCFVRVLDNFATGHKRNISHNLKDENFELIDGSILCSNARSEALKDINIVFHLACLGVRHSLVDPFENHKVNAEGTFLLLEDALKANINKFIYCSSSEVYGTAKFVPMTEKHVTFPATVYGSSKLAGESYTRAAHLTHGLDAVILRPFNIYGPRSHYEGSSGEVIPKSIMRAIANKDLVIFGDGTITRDFTYVLDTVKALVVAAQSESSTGKTLNISSNFEISLNELAETIIKLVDKTSSSIKYLDSRPGDVLRLYGESLKLEKITSWKPIISFSQGLKETVDYFYALSQSEGIEKLMAEEKEINWS